jgi:hypothetical protein
MSCWARAREVATRVVARQTKTLIVVIVVTKEAARLAAHPPTK